MQSLKGVDPYKVEILSTGLRTAKAREADVVVCVGWVVEDSRKRPFCYGRTEFALDCGPECHNTSYKLRAVLSEREVDCILEKVIDTAYEEADRLRCSIVRLVELEEEAASYARAN